MVNKVIANKIFQIFEEENPRPTTELIFQDEFTLLISVILSARSTDKSVNKVTKELFKNYNTAEKILLLGESKLIQYINKIGLFNNKAKNIIATCHLLVNKYNSKVPDKFEELITLPGVGRKTANVILNTLFNQNTIAIDTHVYRVSRRIGLAQSDSLKILEQELIENIPYKWIKNLHHWLVLHGRYICKARNPSCHLCKINVYCKYYKNNFLSLM
ncbi:MAG: endonuclease III [Rickettsia sp.]|nr:endonuclease III [Rickettsia sp.]